MFTVLLARDEPLWSWVPLWMQEWIPLSGAALFGAVVGSMAHHILQKAERPDVKWFASMLAVIGGGAVTALFEARSVLFGAYCIGMAVAFFARAVVVWWRRPPKERPSGETKP
jgi:hypothetical protein